MNRWFLSLPLGVLLVLLAFAPAYSAEVPKAAEFGVYKPAGDALLPGESLVYYDYVEDGRLKGDPYQSIQAVAAFTQNTQ